MGNISKFALCAFFIILFIVPIAFAANMAGPPLKQTMTTASTGKAQLTNTSITTSLNTPMKLIVLTNGSTNKNAKTAMTNHTFFTGSMYLVPPKSAGWPEVKDAYRENIFKDIHEDDTESVARRFEIIFFISLPPTLLLNTLILTVVKYAETQVVGGDFDTVRNYYLYTGSVLMSVGIACQDYRNVKKRREAEGLRWEILQKKF